MKSYYTLLAESFGRAFVHSPQTTVDSDDALI
jgi:hypothetical protein